MDQTPEQAATNDSSPSEADLLKDIQVLWSELRELGHEHFRLAALETQRAGLSLVAMVVVGILLAFLLNVAWIGLMAAGVIGLIEHGILSSSAILLAVAVSLLLALILIGVIRRKSRYLLYPAILGSLRRMPPKARER